MAGNFGGRDALDFYVTLVGMGSYVVSNRFTLKMFAGRNYFERPARTAISNMHVDMLLFYLRPTPSAPASS